MKTNFRDLAVIGGEQGREDNQWPWYEFFKQWMNGKTILDVGTGICRIKQRLAEMGWTSVVRTQEPCVECAADYHQPLSALPSKSFQTVTCFDVVEHVKDYGRLIFDMARISQKYLVITTPGVDVTKCTNPCHWHEFTTDELAQLLSATGMSFVLAHGGYWESWPDKHLRSEMLTEQQLKDRVSVHPIALVYEHKSIHTT